MQLLLNVGGPDRVSRVQMAQVVADIRGYNPSLIKPVSASSVCIPYHNHSKILSFLTYWQHVLCVIEILLSSPIFDDC